ncbi:MAG TPA: hypothetical protein VIL43_14405, partial [Burkholderiales bacterium]
ALRHRAQRGRCSMKRLDIPLPRDRALRVAAGEGRLLLQLIEPSGAPGSALVLPAEAAQDVARALERLAGASAAPHESAHGDGAP